MSIESPESNVKFTDEQTRQVETFKSQLVNLQADVSIHSSSLRSLQSEILKSTKEKIQLEEKLVILNQRANDFEKRVEKATEERLLQEKALETALSEQKVVKKQVSDAQEELEKHKLVLEERERTIEVKNQELEGKLKLFASEKVLFDKKFSILSEALNSLH